MIHTTRTDAENLFKRAAPEKGTDAGKLQDFRSAQALRKQEARRDELAERLEKRRLGAVSASTLFRFPS